MNTGKNRISELSNSFSQLTREVVSIETFTSVCAWDDKAKKLLEEILEELNLIEKAIEDSKNRSSELKEKEEKRSILKKIFGSENEYKSISNHLVKLNSWAATLDSLADKLQSIIDMTPNTQEDQKSLIKEMKLRKKELQIEKKEVEAEMRTMRVESRQRKAVVSNYGFRSLSKIAAAERMRLRLKHELEIAPHEDSKGIIERQILQLEKQIVWVEKLK